MKSWQTIDRILLPGLVLVWAGVGGFILFEIAPTGCRTSAEVVLFAAAFALAFGLASTSVAIAVRLAWRPDLSRCWKTMAAFGALLLFPILCGQSIEWSSRILYVTALPLIETSSGVESCLAHFTPNFLHAGDEMFRALLVACAATVLLVCVRVGRSLSCLARSPPVE